MSGERRFGGARENADAMFGARLLRRKDERALRQIRLSRHRLHRLRVEPRRLGEDEQLIALQPAIGEHVEMDVAERAWRVRLPRTSGRCLCRCAQREAGDADECLLPERAPIHVSHRYTPGGPEGPPLRSTTPDTFTRARGILAVATPPPQAARSTVAPIANPASEAAATRRSTPAAP